MESTVWEGHLTNGSGDWVNPPWMRWGLGKKSQGLTVWNLSFGQFQKHPAFFLKLWLIVDFASGFQLVDNWWFGFRLDPVMKGIVT